MAAWGYEFYLLVLKVSLYLSALEDKIRIPARPWNILYIYFGHTPHDQMFSKAMFFFISIITRLNTG